MRGVNRFQSLTQPGNKYLTPRTDHRFTRHALPPEMFQALCGDSWTVRTVVDLAYVFPVPAAHILHDHYYSWFGSAL